MKAMHSLKQPFTITTPAMKTIGIVASVRELESQVIQFLLQQGNEEALT